MMNTTIKSPNGHTWDVLTEPRTVETPQGTMTAVVACNRKAVAGRDLAVAVTVSGLPGRIVFKPVPTVEAGNALIDEQFAKYAK